MEPPSVVDRTGLQGKVMVGYQGWFNCPNDGMNLGWKHWARDKTKPVSLPSNCVVDFLPDVSEYDADELHETDMRNADGERINLFSSANRKTVVRHVRWMQEYGIDGVFLQRFGNGLHQKRYLHHNDVVLENIIDGAQQHGRTFAVMYDLSGMKAGTVQKTVLNDWKSIQDRVTRSKRYQLHNDKPLLAVWGVGFKNRLYSLQECHALVQSLIVDTGCSIMLGFPTGWREMNRDCVPDPSLQAIAQMADIISPWTVGRYRFPEEVRKHAERYWAPDLEWCKRHNMDYMPVAFPGFSWHNLRCKDDCPLDQIQRLNGDFFWSQVSESYGKGCSMLYIAMFDEVDEGTAIFKCTSNVVPGCFCSYGNLPSDHYLILAGKAARLYGSRCPSS